MEQAVALPTQGKLLEHGGVSPVVGITLTSDKLCEDVVPRSHSLHTVLLCTGIRTEDPFLFRPTWRFLFGLPIIAK